MAILVTRSNLWCYFVPTHKIWDKSPNHGQSYGYFFQNRRWRAAFSYFMRKCLISISILLSFGLHLYRKLRITHVPTCKKNGKKLAGVMEALVGGKKCW